MSDNTFPGSNLRAKREALDLTVADVFRQIRIPPDIINALEESRVNDLPPRTFATGFLKSYCELLGLDGESYAAALQEATRKPTGIMSIAEQDPADRPPWLNDTIAWAAIIALLAIGWITYSIAVQPQAVESDRTVQAETLLFEEDH